VPLLMILLKICFAGRE
jgi:hypothetical protein